VPMTEIPRASQKAIVDVVGMLGATLKNVTGMVKNGPFLWARREPNGSVSMSVEMATELFQLARTYRYYYRVMATSPLERPGLTMEEWTRFKAEAEELCRNLDEIYPGR